MVDAEGNRLFVNDRGGLVQIDGATHQVKRVEGASAESYAFGLTFDQAMNRVVSGGVMSRSMQVVRAP